MLTITLHNQNFLAVILAVAVAFYLELWTDWIGFAWRHLLPHSRRRGDHAGQH